MLGGVLSSCEPTYPARTLTAQLEKMARDEEKLSITAHATGKTLWVYVPLEGLVSETDLSWNAKEIEKLGKVLSIVHRVILSTDAELDFMVIVASDVKKFGVQLITYEYVPDVKQAILEKFSRGEFFRRSIKDVVVNPAAIGDLTGESISYFDLSFDRFLGLQVVHRAKNLFARDKTLSKIYDLKSTSQSERFGTIKIEMEFLKKTYDLTLEEENIKPLDYIKMIAAQVAANYDFKNFQAFELKDTFSGETATLDIAALKKVKIDLPELLEE